MIKRWIYVLSLIAFVSVIAFFMGGSTSLANDVYIAQTAVGAGNGADCADALAASYFNTASNWTPGTPTGTQIGPGTTVHVCGTLTGAAGVNGILRFQGSGSSGEPITLKFETGASLSAPYCNWVGNSGGCLIMSTPSNPRSYLLVDGGTPCGWTQATGSEGTCHGAIVNTQNGAGLRYQTTTNGIEMQSCTNCEVRNLGIYNLYQESGGDTAANPQGENCISFSGWNILIHDSQMHDVGWCMYYIESNGDNNLKIYNNDIYNTPHPFNWSAGSNGTATNGYIYSNHFHDYENWNTPSCRFHVEGIHTDGTGANFNGLYIYNNFFGPGSGNCLFSNVYFSPDTRAAGSHAMVNQSAVFNNVIVVDGAAGEYGICMGGGNGNVVYNNTMVNNNTTSKATGVGLNWGNISQNRGYTFTFKNNATQGFWAQVMDDTTGSEDSSGATITADYNVYSQCPSWETAEGNCLQAFVTGGARSNWSTYLRNSFGQERHSINTGLFSGGYCCTGTLGLNSSYQPTSTRLNAGTNLFSACNGQPIPGIGALCSDFGGTARPASGAWTMGAYQYTPPSRAAGRRKAKAY